MTDLTNRLHGFFYAVLFFGYVWFCFNGLTGGIFELLETVLPRFFAGGYALAIVSGIGALICYRGFSDKSWFDRFHRDTFDKGWYYRSWRGYVFGLVYYISVVSIAVLFFWSIPTFSGKSSWVVVPLMIGLWAAVFILIWVLRRLADWMEVDYGDTALRRSNSR